MKAFHALFFFLFLSGKIIYAQDSLHITDGENVLRSYALVYGDTLNEKKKGKVTAYYASDTSQVAFEQYYMNGKKNGVYKAYFPNGKLLEFGVFGNGIRHGEWTWYDETGYILVKGRYKEGKRHGYWAYRKKECYGHYRNDLKSGKWSCWVNGEKVKSSYKKGQEVTQPASRNK